MIEQSIKDLQICQFKTVVNKEIWNTKNFYQVLNISVETGKKCFGKANELNMTKNICNFTRYDNHSGDEILYNNGSEIGLYEVDGESKSAEVILRDRKLVVDGANEMQKQLLELSSNGFYFRKLLVVGKSSDLFLNTSGFVLSGVRYLRAYYCVQEITDAMKRVVSLKNNLLNYRTIKELNDMRKNITDGIEKVATLENVANTKYGKGSSMALVGYFALNKNQFNDKFSKCNRNGEQCISFFHISAHNDTRFDVKEDDFNHEQLTKN
uniref:Uncharacterized protein n=1 Tax=Meloidogyne javanica TaxID=6303 RepID=A0A915LU53_MELJA